MTIEEVSHRIEQLADERNMSRYALAELCPEVVQSTIYNALSGKKSMKLETLFYICRALGVSLKDFFDMDKEAEEIFSEDEKIVAITYRNLNEKMKIRLMGYMSSLIDKK